MSGELDGSFPSGERHVLALDGGGVRGIVTLHLLHAFEERFGVRACDFFDMFVGTSTGAIIAACLAFTRLTSREVLDLYRELIPVVFGRTWRTVAPMRYVVPALYSREPALEKLDELFRERLLGDLARERPQDPQAILLTTHDLVRNEEIFLSNYPFRTGAPNYGPTWRVRDAVAASALSAPWYFGAYQGRFVDGGMTVFNTPARQGAIEALDYCAVPAFERGKLTVWSFGSGTFASGFSKWDADDWAPWRWAGRLFVDVQSDAEADQIYGALRLARAGDIRFRRYQITITSETISQLRVPVVTPELPIQLDRADALEFLDDLGVRFASRVDWAKEDGFLLRPDPTDPFADPDLWRSSEPPPQPVKPPSARLS